FNRDRQDCETRVAVPRMTRRQLLQLLAAASAASRTARVNASLLQRASRNEPPMIPIGLDSYLMWERWPYQRIGARAYMRSTYDRKGGNGRAAGRGRRKREGPRLHLAGRLRRSWAPRSTSCRPPTGVSAT